jgi:hypothetical protein
VYTLRVPHNSVVAKRGGESGGRGLISKVFGSDVSDVNVVNVAGTSSRIENATKADGLTLHGQEYHQ